MTTRSVGTYKPAAASAPAPTRTESGAGPRRTGSASGWNMTPEEEAIFERAQLLKRESQAVISHSQSTRKAIGGNLVDHFKFLLVMGPTELKKEVKARFDAWDEDKSGQLSKTEMMHAMEEMGKKPTPEELEKFMQEVDLDGNGTVDLGEFEHMIRHQLSIAHTCDCTFCTKKKQSEAEAEKAAEEAEAAAAAAKKKK